MWTCIAKFFFFISSFILLFEVIWGNFKIEQFQICWNLYIKNKAKIKQSKFKEILKISKSS